MHMPEFCRQFWGLQLLHCCCCWNFSPLLGELPPLTFTFVVVVGAAAETAAAGPVHNPEGRQIPYVSCLLAAKMAASGVFSSFPSWSKPTVDGVPGDSDLAAPNPIKVSQSPKESADGDCNAIPQSIFVFFSNNNEWYCSVDRRSSLENY
jgi:hypothetical protein